MFTILFSKAVSSTKWFFVSPQAKCRLFFLSGEITWSNTDINRVILFSDCLSEHFVAWRKVECTAQWPTVSSLLQVSVCYICFLSRYLVSQFWYNVMIMYHLSFLINLASYDHNYGVVLWPLFLKCFVPFFG